MKNRKFAWELFKTTGSIDAYMLLKDVEYSEEIQNMQNTGKIGDFSVEKRLDNYQLIVTKIVNYSDNDKILTVITADQGKIQVFCKGAQKIKNSILASTEFLAFSEFVLYEGSSDMYKMSSAEIIEVFYNLRIDIEKLVYATTMSQIMNDVCLEEELCMKKLQLFLNTLYTLSETDKNLDFVYSVFCVRLLALLGYIPRLRCLRGLRKECNRD